MSMDVREMGADDSFVVIETDPEATSAWPPWKHLLEDVAEAKPTPISLKLAYKNLGDAGAHRLAELLQSKLCNLVSLDLSCTSIGTGGAVAIANAIGSHACLKALDISSNAVTDAGCAAFAKSLTTNSLHACLIGDKGALALAEALQINRTLCEVNLRQNYISDQGAVALAGALRDSPSLLVMDVQGNSFRTEGRKALAAAFEANARVAQAMPLSWYAGQDSAHARAKLAQPPRSLVSVDSAGAPVALRKHDSGLQRKKPANASNIAPMPPSPNSHRRSGSPDDTTATQAKWAESHSPVAQGSHRAVRDSYFKEEGSDAGEKSKSRSWIVAHCLYGARGCLSSVGTSRIAVLRAVLLAAILIATAGLWLLSSQMEDIELGRSQGRSKIRNTGKGAGGGGIAGESMKALVRDHDAANASKPTITLARARQK